jgi:chromosome partitioning protein
MKIITIANTKGGTAKTTTTLNLGTELGILGYKILIVDFDPQGSISKAILGENNLLSLRGIEELLNNPNLEIEAFISKTKIENVNIIACHSSLTETSLKLLMSASFFALKDIIRNINDFDFVLIDTQPSKNILMLNTFSCSNYVLIPTNPSVYPLMDIVELEKTINDSKSSSNPNLEILGVLITMVQKATVYKQLESELRKYFNYLVFDTTISRAAKSEESALEGIGVSSLDSKCKLSLEYKKLTLEILKRLEG